MKTLNKIILAAMGMSLIPFFASASIAVGWNASSTNIGFIQPNAVNGNIDGIKIPFFTSTSTTDVSNIAGDLITTGSVWMQGGFNGAVAYGANPPDDSAMLQIFSPTSGSLTDPYSVLKVSDNAGLTFHTLYGVNANPKAFNTGAGDAVYGVYSHPSLQSFSSSPESVYAFYGAPSGVDNLGGGINNYGIYLTGETYNYFSGDVGIGNAFPTVPLQVNGTASTTNLTVSALPNLSCIGTNSSGNLQSGTCTGGSSFGKSWEINTASQLAPTTTIDVLAPRNLNASSSLLVGNLITSSSISATSTTATSTITNSLALATSTSNSMLEVNGSIHSEEQVLATSTSMSIDFCSKSTSNRLRMGVGSANISLTFTNYAACPGKSVILRVWNPSSGVIGSTTPTATKFYWDGYVNPGNNVTFGGMDEFEFDSVNGSTTPFIWAKLNSTLP